MQVVLVEPEIPQNTGNIARTCAVTGVPLHLIEPLGFFLDDRHLKRAGLDYWSLVQVRLWPAWEDFLVAMPASRVYLYSKWGDRSYHQVAYRKDDLLVFGSETRGLSREWLAAYPDGILRIPMLPRSRSLNLSNSVAIVLYEALRQQGFPDLQ